MQPGTPEYAAELGALCAKLTETATSATRAIEMQGRQIAALMVGMACLSRELQERHGLDRVALVETALAAMRAEIGEDPERDSVLRSLLGQAGEASAEGTAPGSTLRLIPGGKV